MTPRSLFLVSFIAFVTIFSILNCFFDRSNDLLSAEASLYTYCQIVIVKIELKFSYN